MPPGGAAADPRPSYADAKAAYEQAWATTSTGPPAPVSPPTAAAAPSSSLAPAPTTRHEFARLVGTGAWIPPECLTPVRRLGAGSFATGEREMR